MNRRQNNSKRKSGRRYLRKKERDNFFLTRDFSSLEDAPNSFDIIRDIVYRAGKNAAAEAKAAGLPQTFARNNQIIRKTHTGEEEVIETAEASPIKTATFYIRYKPSTVLHARKK